VQDATMDLGSRTKGVFQKIEEFDGQTSGFGLF
jgi:hypothetical protein